MGILTLFFFANAIASGYPASTCRTTPIPGSFVKTRSIRAAISFVPSATVKLAPHAANTQSPRRRHCESRPTTPRSPYSPTHSVAANPQSHPTHPASIPSRDMAKTPTRNPDDPAPSLPALSIRRAPPTHSTPTQTCPAPHTPASKSAKAAPEISRASAPT